MPLSSFSVCIFFYLIVMKCLLIHISSLKLHIFNQFKLLSYNVNTFWFFVQICLHLKYFWFFWSTNLLWCFYFVYLHYISLDSWSCINEVQSSLDYIYPYFLNNWSFSFILCMFRFELFCLWNVVFIPTVSCFLLCVTQLLSFDSFFRLLAKILTPRI